MEALADLDFESFNFPTPKTSTSEDFCQEVQRDGRKYFHCTFPDCGKIFRFKSEFQRHKVIHIVSRPFVCNHEGCGKTFKREDALKNHVRIHTGELPFKCEMPGCGLRFPTKAGLRYHLLKHKGERVCACNYPGCNKTFLTMAQLRQHENANNFHRPPATNPSPATVEESTEAMFNFEEKGKDLFLDEFFAPDLKPAQTIQWEMKNQADCDIPISSSVQDSFEKMVKSILKENTRLKQRLEVCNKLMNLMQENQELKQKLNNTNSFLEAPRKEDDVFSFFNLDDDTKGFQSGF